MTASVRYLYRYPVKGLSPEALASVALREGCPFPGDRSYALARPETAFDPTTPQPLPKTAFLMLMRDAALARLDTHYRDDSRELVIRLDGEETVRGRLDVPAERARIETWLRRYAGGDADHGPRIVAAPGHHFTDVSVHSPTLMRAVSLINLASVRELERVAGATVDPLRFRANIYVDGMPPWVEREWLGERVTLGGVPADVLKATTRCAATEVEPGTGVRNLRVPRLLRDHFGHVELGVYLRVAGAGPLAPGDRFEAPARATGAAETTG